MVGKRGDANLRQEGGLGYWKTVMGGSGKPPPGKASSPDEDVQIIESHQQRSQHGGVTQEGTYRRPGTSHSQPSAPGPCVSNLSLKMSKVHLSTQRRQLHLESQIAPIPFEGAKASSNDPSLMSTSPLFPLSRTDMVDLCAMGLDDDLGEQGDAPSPVIKPRRGRPPSIRAQPAGVSPPSSAFPSADAHVSPKAHAPSLQFNAYPVRRPPRAAATAKGSSVPRSEAVPVKKAAAVLSSGPSALPISDQTVGLRGYSFDLEATSLNTAEARILEIAAVDIETGK